MTAAARKDEPQDLLSHHVKPEEMLWQKLQFRRRRCLHRKDFAAQQPMSPVLECRARICARAA